MKLTAVVRQFSLSDPALVGWQVFYQSSSTSVYQLRYCRAAYSFPRPLTPSAVPTIQLPDLSPAARVPSICLLHIPVELSEAFEAEFDLCVTLTTPGPSASRVHRFTPHPSAARSPSRMNASIVAAAIDPHLCLSEAAARAGEVTSLLVSRDQ